LRSSVATARGLANHYRSIARAPCPAAIAADFRQIRETAGGRIAHDKFRSHPTAAQMQDRRPFGRRSCTKQ
jgi:hypothetical protein